MHTSSQPKYSEVSHRNRKLMFVYISLSLKDCHYVHPFADFGRASAAVPFSTTMLASGAGVETI